MAMVCRKEEHLFSSLCKVTLSTGFAFRFEHRKWNRGRNRLPKLVQTMSWVKSPA